MHLKVARSGEPEWSLRNGGCFAVSGAKMRTKEWGKYEELSAGMIEWKPRPICS